MAAAACSGVGAWAHAAAAHANRPASPAPRGIINSLYAKNGAGSLRRRSYSCGLAPLLLALLQLFALFLEHGLPAQLDFVAFERQHLYQDLVAFLQLVADVADAVFRDFADVQ